MHVDSYHPFTGCTIFQWDESIESPIQGPAGNSLGVQWLGLGSFSSGAGV